MSQSTQSPQRRKPRSRKPAKPYPDFPLFPHATRRWAKKIRGKLYYFGPWDDPVGAVEQYVEERDALYAGRKPNRNRDALTVRELCNSFLSAKQAKVESGEIVPPTWKGYFGTCKRLVDFFGKTRLVEDLCGNDFDELRAEFAKTNGLVGLKNQITHARMVFNYAVKAELVSTPVRFGANFVRPASKAIRKQRTPRMFEDFEVRRMLDHASPIMRAMVLLGVNAGFGPADIGRLPSRAVNLEAGWITFARPKTGAERRIPLWPETVLALRDALKVRPNPASDEHKDRIFLTRTGGAWYKESTRYLSEQFAQFLKSIDAQAEKEAAKQGAKPPPKLYRRGRGFHTLRHVCETIGGESCDQVAVDAIMGHERGDMGSHYRERISDERLQRVVKAVREWLLAEIEQEDEKAILPFRVVR